MRARSVLWSFNYAIQGIVFALRTQRNMRLHALAAITVLVGALFFRISALELMVLSLAIAFVLVAELVNTAVEAAVDVATEAFDPTGKIAKDVAAGAVLVASFNAIVVGYLLFFQRFSGTLETVFTTVRQAPTHLTAIGVGLTLILVIVAKAFSGEGTFVSGGWPSGHTTLAFFLATSAGFVTESARATVIALFIAALVAQSRVQAGAHTIPQVILGGLLGSMLSVAVFSLFLG